jgi:drug/metabolite transporter (DMT)-like permease
VSARWLSLAVVAAAFICYHLAQRSMPEGLRPAPLFTFVYGAATVVMAAVLTIDRSAGGLRAVTAGAAHWEPWLLVASITGIELGVYAMYRAGWSIGTANTTSQAVVTMILAVVGLAAFSEHLTPTKVAGLAMCVVGGSLVVAR